MFGIDVLDVVIGLVFVYLLLSLVASAINERAAQYMDLRARNLRTGIQQLLQDPDTLEKLYAHPIVVALKRKRNPSKSGPNGKVDSGGKDDMRDPPHIPSRSFSLALLDLAMPLGSGNTLPPDMDAVRDLIQQMPDSMGKTKAALLAHANVAGQTVDQFRESVEGWFDDSMERVSNSYKRNMQKWLLLTALIVTVLFNANTFAIVKALSGMTPEQRKEVVQAATQFVERSEQQGSPPVNGANEPSDAPGANEQIDLLESTIAGLSLPLGWSDATVPKAEPFAWLFHLLGWIVTATFVSLGAPFWFDFLKHLTTLRSGATKKSGEASV